MAEETRRCRWCGATVPRMAFCSDCIMAWPARPAPETLSADEREAELRLLGESVEVPFDLMHQRIEALLGRPVWTHEFGLNWEGLCQEVRWEGRPSTLQDIIELIPEAKRIVIEVGTPDGLVEAEELVRERG